VLSGAKGTLGLSAEMRERERSLAAGGVHICPHGSEAVPYKPWDRLRTLHFEEESAGFCQKPKGAQEIPPPLSGETSLFIEGGREGAAREFCFWLLHSREDRIHRSARRSWSLPR
jgi:hypothetical protein